MFEIQDTKMVSNIHQIIFIVARVRTSVDTHVLSFLTIWYTDKNILDHLMTFRTIFE